MWQCMKCWESVEDPFNVCWSCGTSRDGVEDPAFEKVEGADVSTSSEAFCLVDSTIPSEPPPAEHATDGLPVCAVCGGAREEGFLWDIFEGGAKPGRWIEGKPERSFWRGTNTGDRRSFRVQAFRCVECGRVELFARESSEFPE